MAIVVIKAGGVTDRDADPQVKMNSIVSQGMSREVVGTIETNDDDSIGSTYILGEVPSNARVSQLLLYCDAVTSGIADFGLYRNTADGSAVVDADFFASAQAISSALNAVDITHESAVFGLEDAELALWEALGLSVDPGVVYDIVATLTAATTAVGTVMAKCKYAI